MWKYILAIPLIMHGLANLAGVVAPWTANLAGFIDAPWIFGAGVTYRGRAGRVSGPVWLFSTLMLCSAGVGLLLGETWWVTLAIIGAVFSLGVIYIWWKAVPPGAHFGAFVDALLLVALISPLKDQIIKLLGG